MFKRLRRRWPQWTVVSEQWTALKQGKGKWEMGKVREKGLRRGRWPQWTVDSGQKRVTPLKQGKGKWERGKEHRKFHKNSTATVGEGLVSSRGK